MPFLSAALYHFTVKNGLIFSVDPHAAVYRILLARRESE
ncbi:hypothetical protein A9D36_19800 [Bacillus subtilis]|nr:hypothetical protein A9D36_19800 [Bacillus subtilis]